MDRCIITLFRGFFSIVFYILYLLEDFQWDLNTELLILSKSFYKYICINVTENKIQFGM